MHTGKTEYCSVCGLRLDNRERGEALTCSYCGKRETGHMFCLRGHYICDHCRGRSSLPLIEDICRTTALTDPLEIAELLIAHPNLPMLGCEHAYITAGALLAALRNSPYGRRRSDDITEAFQRISKQSNGESCGLTGVCVITPAVGSVFSILLGSHCGTDREQRITMEAATQVSRSVAELTGPSCCKAYVRAAVPLAVELFQERLGIFLPLRGPSVCRHGTRHPHGCREEKCPYFRKGASRDIFADAGRSHSACGPT